MSAAPGAAAVASLLAELRGRLGADAVHTTPRELDRCAVAGVRPLAVVLPAGPEDVAAALALCSDAGVPVEPAGGATWLAAGQPPPDPPMVISTARLASVLEYEPADVVAGVQAGMPMAALHAELRRHRQMLPLDPPAAPPASIGATLALAAAGPLRAAHRTPRDFVLGVEIATGDGRLLKFGGRVVKNVAGYDVVRLVTGSRGTLGVITAMHLLLRAEPDADGTLLVPAGTAGEAAGKALALRDAIGCDALEIFSPALAAALGLDDPVRAAAAATTPGAGTPAAATRGGAGISAAATTGRPWVVAARLRGNEAAVAEALDSARGVVRDALTLDGVAATALWQRLSALEAAAPLYLRLASLPADLPRTLAAATTLAAAAGKARSDNGLNLADGWCAAAHGADGIVRLWRAAAAPAISAADFAAALDTAGRDQASRGGTLSCPVLPAELQQIAAPAGGGDAGAAALLRGLRAVFDPAGIMAPGRQPQ
jgi:glycolate oxidase FAD binding subunit